MAVPGPIIQAFVGEMFKAGRDFVSGCAVGVLLARDNPFGYGKDFRHRLGHGIGWDVHEPPFLTKGDTTLVREGMIFTIEPSIFRDMDFSARVEDCIVARPGAVRR